jgi:hypothetical protein
MICLPCRYCKLERAKSSDHETVLYCVHVERTLARGTVVALYTLFTSTLHPINSSIAVFFWLIIILPTDKYVINEWKGEGGFDSLFVIAMFGTPATGRSRNRRFPSLNNEPEMISRENMFMAAFAVRAIVPKKYVTSVRLP